MTNARGLDKFRKESNLSWKDLAHLLGLTRRELYRVREGLLKLSGVQEEKLTKLMAGKLPAKILPISDRPRKYPDDMLPEKIRAIVESVGSAEKLAELTGTTPFSVMRWLNGNAAPSGKHLDRLRELATELLREGLTE